MIRDVVLEVLGRLEKRDERCYVMILSAHDVLAILQQEVREDVTLDEAESIIDELNSVNLVEDMMRAEVVDCYLHWDDYDSKHKNGRYEENV